MMCVNQAASSAILVIALHSTSTGYERFVGALVGGGVALVVSQLVFPPHPLKLLRAAEHQPLNTLAGALEEMVTVLERSPATRTGCSP